MSENTPAEHDFTTRVSAIDALPLSERAAAFTTLHDELATRLESGLRAPADSGAAA